VRLNNPAGLPLSQPRADVRSRTPAGRGAANEPYDFSRQPKVESIQISPDWMKAPRSANAHEIASDRVEHEEPFDQCSPTMAGLAQVADGLDPSEGSSIRFRLIALMR
jgi:hypothetical protein